MPKPEGQALFTQTKLAEGLRELFRQIKERLSLSRPLTLYLAGGMAVHLYTASRVTTDVDAEFGSRVLIPNDLRVKVLLPVDLAVSKIAWLADNDRDDIQELVRRGLTTPGEIEERAISALTGYIGDETMLRLNIQDAVALARDAEPHHGFS